MPLGGPKDDAITQLWVGCIIPALLLVGVGVQLAVGAMLWVRRERRLMTFQILRWSEDPKACAGVLVFEIGLALALVGWHRLANADRTAVAGTALLALGLLGLVCGLALIVAEALRE